MKKCLIAIAVVLSLSMNAGAAAQKHRHTPRTEQVGDTVKNDPDAIEAFSDTTTAAKSDADMNDDDDDSYGYRRHVSFDDADPEDIVREVFSGIGSGAVLAMIIPIVAIVCFGLLLPIIILFTVLYFVNRNRRERYKLAQMAIQNGQPIPDQLLKETVNEGGDRNEYNAGIRQMFTGIGLAIFLGIILDELGFGIGALVFFIGLGKWFIARQNKRNSEDINNLNNLNNERHEQETNEI